MTSTSIVVTATFFPLPDKRDALLDLFTQRLRAVQDEPGCRLCAVHEALDGTILIIEKWDSPELWQIHFDDGPFADSGPILDQLLSEPVRIVRFDPLPFGDPTKGVL
jgi:quinol monooxygenase YgiN